MSGDAAEARGRGPIQLRGLSRGEGRPGRLNHRSGLGHDGGMEPLRIVKGDAIAPQAGGNKIIAHVCNDRGGWGRGFVLALSRRWPEPEWAYRQWHRAGVGEDFGLGAVQLVAVQPDLWVANMVAQHGMRPTGSAPPIRYDAVQRCLEAVAGHAGRLGASVHMPRIGCGLAGGRWELIEPIITRTLCARSIVTTVYDFE
jgi:O-acetyl-ADP-ribose deacetylase (regulator of RNase III)